MKRSILTAAIVLLAMTSQTIASNPFERARKSVETELHRGSRSVMPPQRVDNRSPYVSWSVFSYTGGEFIRNNGRWIEYQNGRPTFFFVEAGRTREYVELFDPSRQIRVRLHGTFSYILKPELGGWVGLYPGQVH